MKLKYVIPLVASAFIFPSTQAYVGPTTPYYANPIIFNWVEYLAANPDLPAAGMTTQTQALNHWLTYGINECRRSVKNFHPAVYLDLHEDLRNAFGNNCRLATEHYMNHGHYEGRVGMHRNSNFGGVVGGTGYIGNELMLVKASRRTAGAIDSLIYRGKEFINAYDHGRQISIAFRNNTFVQGECDNPTEPGSANDGLSSTSTTQILNLNANMLGTLFTKVVPAFWTAPNQTTPDGCQNGPRNDGRYVANDQLLQKNVQLGYKGDPQVMVYDITVFNQRANVPSFQIEAPTGYMTHEFTSFYKLHADGNLGYINMHLWNAVPYGNYTFYGGEQVEPGIISTPDGQFAMGAYSPSHYGVYPTYALYEFPNNAPAISTNKWSIVFRLGQINPGDYHFRSYIVMGNLNEVRERLHWLRNGW